MYLLGRDLYGPSAHAAVRQGFDLTPKPPHMPAKATAVIQLFQNGGPSQVDLFDPKPRLDRDHGKSPPSEIAAVVSSPNAAGGLMRSPFTFQQHGQSGIWLSDAMPYLAKQVDDIAVIRSIYNSHPNHEPALFKIHSGELLPGRPALGAWVVYGLGSENQSLPAYIVLDDPQGLPVNGLQSWKSGFLPPIYQGTRLRATGTPMLHLKPDHEGQPEEIVQARRDLMARLDRLHQQDRPHQLALDARIKSYELAARMQLEASDALDLSREDAKTLEAYGVNNPTTASYARRCVLARRLVERGVRYVQLFISGQSWDHHNRLKDGMKSICDRTDQPVAALLADLKQRGMLDRTLVVWGGEFGRLPIAQLGPKSDASNAGRDHGPKGFSLWMAGGGIKGGTVHGGTDEIGFAAVDKPVSVADWHATILHQLGLHHEELYFDRNGLKDRLTGTQVPRVVREILV
jgi:hypothetical protein